MVFILNPFSFLFPSHVADSCAHRTILYQAEMDSNTKEM